MRGKHLVGVLLVAACLLTGCSRTPSRSDHAAATASGSGTPHPTIAPSTTEATTRAIGGGPDLRSWTFWQTVGGVVVEPVVPVPSHLTSLVKSTTAIARGTIAAVRPGPVEGVYGRVVVTVSTRTGSVDVVLLHPPSVTVQTLRSKLPTEEAVFFLSRPTGAGAHQEWDCAQYYFCAITWPLKSALRPDADVGSWPDVARVQNLAALVMESVRLSGGTLVEL